MNERPDRELEHRLRNGLREVGPGRMRLEDSILAAIGDRTPTEVVRDDKTRVFGRAALLGSVLWLALVGLLVWLQGHRDPGHPASGPEEAMTGLYQWVDAIPPAEGEHPDEARVLGRLFAGERSP